MWSRWYRMCMILSASFLIMALCQSLWPCTRAAENPESRIISSDRVTVRWLLVTHTVDFKGHFDINQIWRKLLSDVCILFLLPADHCLYQNCLLGNSLKAMKTLNTCHHLLCLWCLQVLLYKNQRSKCLWKWLRVYGEIVFVWTVLPVTALGKHICLLRWGFCLLGSLNPPPVIFTRYKLPQPAENEMWLLLFGRILIHYLRSQLTTHASFCW